MAGVLDLDLYGTDGRMFLATDVHGAFRMLEQALGQAGYDPERDVLILGGDLIDRGPHSHECLEWMARDRVHAVMGNHEEMAIGVEEGLVMRDDHVEDGGAWFHDLEPGDRQRYARAFGQLPYAIAATTPKGRRIGVVHADIEGNGFGDSTPKEGKNHMSIRDDELEGLAIEALRAVEGHGLPHETNRLGSQWQEHDGTRIGTVGQREKRGECYVSFYLPIHPSYLDIAGRMDADPLHVSVDANPQAAVSALMTKLRDRVRLDRRDAEILRQGHEAPPLWAFEADAVTIAILKAAGFDLETMSQDDLAEILAGGKTVAHESADIAIVANGSHIMALADFYGDKVRSYRDETGPQIVFSRNMLAALPETLRHTLYDIPFGRLFEHPLFGGIEAMPTGMTATSEKTVIHLERRSIPLGTAPSGVDRSWLLATRTHPDHHGMPGSWRTVGIDDDEFPG